MATSQMLSFAFILAVAVIALGICSQADASKIEPTHPTSQQREHTRKENDSSNPKRRQPRGFGRRLKQEEDDPISRSRAKKLFHRLAEYNQVLGRYRSIEDGPSLVDYLNRRKSQEETQSRRATETTDEFPSTRAWIIGLTGTPVWLCQSEDCPSPQGQQDELIEYLQEEFPSIRIVGQVYRILNAINVELPFDVEISPTAHSHIEYVALQQEYVITDNLMDTVETVGGAFAQRFCLTGQGVKVGVIDTGIDYTHAAFGGPGTVQAFQQAYGFTPSSTENTSRDGLFPTAQVTGGIDFLGETLDNFVADDDPIDGQGHGTAVASAIVAMAPDVELLAVKACVTDEGLSCKEFAIIQGIEYLTDPNGDGNINDKADVINLSVSIPFTRPFHSSVVRGLENAAQLGIVCVTSFGNDGNIPYIVGAIGAAPNVIAVGATNQPTEDDPIPYMETYSSRGPGEGNLIKPDISAPGTIILADYSTGTGYSARGGTSFSAPIVAGAVALLKQQCPGCDPLAIKALLMNSADRDVSYSSDERDRKAPITRMGGGQLRVDRALNATLWAISLEERQPSLTFGTVNAFGDIIFTKTIEVNAIDSRARFLQFDSEFRDPAKSDVLAISFNPPEVFMPGNCAAVLVQVQFLVKGGAAPSNAMTTSGTRAYDPSLLDRHEFDGHILITSDVDQEAALPFHMLIRQSGAPVLGRGTGITFKNGPIDQNFTITNEGVGISQIDTYELIYSEFDRPEASYGEALVSYDIRTIGYRTVPVGEPNCDFSVEFNFQTWEKFTHVGLHSILAEVYPNGEDGEMVTLFLPTFPSVSESYILYESGESFCTGLSSDHSSNTANTVLRVCSNDLLLTNNQTDFTVQFRTAAYPFAITEEFVTSKVNVQFPTPSLSAPSYDIAPQTTLEEFHVTGFMTPDTSFGLQLVTNAYRGPERTGASTFESETILLLRRGTVLEEEVTTDLVIWPGLFNQGGPICGLSLPEEQTCDAISIPDSELPEINIAFLDEDFTASPDCPPVDVPRLDVPTAEPTDTPSNFPSFSPVPPTARPPSELPPPAFEEPTLPPSASLRRIVHSKVLLLGTILVWYMF